MREILDLFVELDTYARDTYRGMASAARNERLRNVFAEMSAEEATHLQWWSDLVKAWARGLVPDIVNDTCSLESKLRELLEELRSASPEDLSTLSDDEMLQAATRLEFYMLDPVFAELLDLTGPGTSRQHRKAYQVHVDRLVGAIEECYSPDPLASFLARVLREAWRQNQELANHATRDPLTGLHNRRGLMAHFRQWAAWAERYARPVAVLLVDVDDFKMINDTCGHTVGDTTLTAVARVLRDSVRGSDMVARYGGDEFAIVAPETGSADLAPVTSRILERVRAIELPGGCDFEVSVSIGCAVAEGTGGEASTDGLLAAADHSLYEAKHKGKDQVGEIIRLGGEV